MPPLTDPNPDGNSTELLERAVDDCIDGFFDFIREAYRSGDEVVLAHRRLSARYAVGVVFHGGDERWFRVQFEEAEPRFDRSSVSPPADAVHRIAASVLRAWAVREKSYFYFRAYSRKFTTLYALSKVGDKVTVEPKELTDLLGYYLQWKAKGADMALKQRLDLQLEPYVRRAKA